MKRRKKTDQHYGFQQQQHSAPLDVDLGLNLSVVDRKAIKCGTLRDPETRATRVAELWELHRTVTKVLLGKLRDQPGEVSSYHIANCIVWLKANGITIDKMKDASDLEKGLQELSEVDLPFKIN